MADKKISALTAATTPLAGTEVLPIVQGGVTVKVSVDNLTDGKTVTANKFYAPSTDASPIDIRRSVANNTILVNLADSPSLTNTNYVLFGIDTTGGSVGYSTGGAFVSTGSNGTGTARSLILHTYGNNDIVFARQNTQIASISANGFAPIAGKGIDFSAATHAAGMTSELLNDYEEGTWTPTLTSDGTPPTVTGYASRYGSYTKIGNRVYISVNIRATVTAVGTGTPQVTGFPYAANGNALNGISLGLTDLMIVPFNANFISGSTLNLALGAYTVVTNGYLTFSAMYEI